MKRWDVFDFLARCARRQNLRYRLEKDWESDSFYFDDLLQCSVNGARVSVALAVIRISKVRMDVVRHDGLEQLRLNTDTLSLEDRA